MREGDLLFRVLVDDAVWTVLQWHDRVRFGDVSSPYGAFISPAEIASRMSTSRFDMDDRARLPWRFYGATLTILARL